MYKVTITGVSTNDLKTLSNEEMMLLIPLSQNGDEQARNALIEGNLKLILSILKKFRNKKESLDDLFQVGVIGLMKAIDNFNSSLGVMFSTYAVPMIIGEIKRYLRDNSIVRVSRSLKDIAYKALSMKDAYYNEHQKEPSIEEIAESIQCDPVDVLMALDAILDPISIYTPIYDNGNDAILLEDQISGKENFEEGCCVHESIKDAYSILEDREKKIISKRYFENKTQLEIAEELDISQAQVSRIEKNALLRMRKRMEWKEDNKSSI